MLSNYGGRCHTSATISERAGLKTQNVRAITPDEKLFSDGLQPLAFLDVYVGSLCLAEVQLAGTPDLELRIVELLFPL